MVGFSESSSSPGNLELKDSPPHSSGITSLEAPLPLAFRIPAQRTPLPLGIPIYCHGMDRYFLESELKSLFLSNSLLNLVIRDGLRFVVLNLWAN